METASSEAVERLAAAQVRLYRDHPMEMRPHYIHERSVERAYRGRQLLELLQNADDAGRGYSGPARLSIRLLDAFLVVANQGMPFSDEGIESLVISDRSPKQLARARYIGEKGLGFRSLLSWSDRPLVSSGEHRIAFAPEHALATARMIAENVPALAADMERFRQEHGNLPIPVMRFPFVPSSSDPALLIAESVRNEGFDTVIVLPLPAVARGAAVRAEIVRQAAELDASTVLFANWLSLLEVSADAVVASWAVRRRRLGERSTVDLEDDHGTSQWTIVRREVEVPAGFSEDGETVQHAQLAVAVPDQPDFLPSAHRLCVFFPTSITLPMAMLLHATIETDDSRKRLIDSPATEFILARLAELVAEVAESESKEDDPWRSLKLLAGAERADPDLGRLKFLDALLRGVCHRRVFPILDGRLVTGSEAWLAPTETWRQVASADWLPELLAEPPADDVVALIEALDLASMPVDKQTGRLEARIATLAASGQPELAGTLIGALLAGRSLPKQNLPDVLIDDNGHVLPSSASALLPPENERFRHPPWVTDIRFLHPRFVEALREKTKATARELSSLLSAAGYAIDEYQLESVARKLVKAAKEGTTGGPSDTLQRHREVLACIYEMTREQAADSVISAGFQVITTAGNLRRATDCYLGPEYPNGVLLHALYGALGEDEFCAAPSALGLPVSATDAERFLRRLGVAATVRRVELDAPYKLSNAGLDGHVRETFARLKYPHDLAERIFHSSDEAYAALSVHYGSYGMLDRWRDVLKQGSAEAIVAFIVTQGVTHLDSRHNPGIVLRVQSGQQINWRRSQTVAVSDPVLYLLRETAWVPCEDGERREPRQIALSSVGRRVFGRAFHAHDIDTRSSLLASAGGTAAVQMVLEAAGAMRSLDALRSDDIYALLLDLPNRDPEGSVAASFYRTLLEAEHSDLTSPRRLEFIRVGRMWGMKAGVSAYFPVSELRYASRSAIPEPVREHVALVAIDPRRGPLEVERVFGVSAINAQDYEITIEDAGTAPVPWSREAGERLREAIPFLYAFRLSRRTDDKGDERRAFFDIELVVCRQIAAHVRVVGQTPESVEISDDLKGLTAGRRIYIVSSGMGLSDDPVFWRAVGDLLADVLGISRAGGDFGSLLTCSDPFQRGRLLHHMTGDGTRLLAQARAALEMPEAPEEDILPIPHPRPVTEFVATSPLQTESVTTQPDCSRTPESSSADLTDKPLSLPSITAIAPPQPPSSGGTRPMVVATERPGLPIEPRLPVDERLTLAIVERFEEAATPPRYPVRVAHLHGTEAFGCDIISLASVAAREAALRDRMVNRDDIVRYIEVKGRSLRMSPIELTENERAAAIRHRERYFIYRVFVDAAQPGQFELALLPNPVGSSAERSAVRYAYTFADGSGAEWYRLSNLAAPAPDQEDDAEPLAF